MRVIRYAFLFLVGLSLVTLALANRNTVELRLVPEAMGPSFGLSGYVIQLPLFLVILMGILAGLVLGFIWEFMREHKHRAALAHKEGEVKTLRKEIDQIKAEQGEPQDEILALLDKT